MSPSLISEAVLSESAAASLAMKPLDSSPADFIFRSKLPDIDIPFHMPLADYCLEKATQWADKVCLIDGNTGKEYRYGEIELLTRRVAAGLAKLGVPQGGVIALLLPNCAEFVTVFLGAAKRGAVVTTANPFYTAAELAKQIKASGATVVVTQESYIEKLNGLNVQVLAIPAYSVLQTGQYFKFLGKSQSHANQYSYLKLFKPMSTSHSQDTADAPFPCG